MDNKHPLQSLEGTQAHQSLAMAPSTSVLPTQFPGPLVLHIPHSSRIIPGELRSQLLLDDGALRQELLLMTDWLTDDLFDVCGYVKVVFPVSRLIVDPERFTSDAEEIMSSMGMGVIYTQTANGQRLRDALSPESREALLSTYYTPHHVNLSQAVDHALNAQGGCLLIDCHSFPSRPLPYELDQESDRLPICLGTDPFHTPTWLREALFAAFSGCGLPGMKVAINRPFSGALVPTKHYRRDPRVLACMIEIYRSSYMNEATGQRLASFPAVKAAIHQVLDELVETWRTHQYPAAPRLARSQVYGVQQ